MPNTLFHAPETPPPAERTRDLPLRPEAGTAPFRRLLERTLPPEIASELTAEFDPAAHRSSRLRIALAALLTAAIAALAWLLFPRTSPEPIQALGTRDLHRDPPSFFSSYRRAYDRALEAYKDRRYAACAEQLLPHVAKLADAPPGENAPVALLFFDAIRAGAPSPEVRAAACDAAAALVRNDPEDPRWRLCDLELNHRARLDCEGLLRALKAGEYRQSSGIYALEGRLNEALASVRKARQNAAPDDQWLQTLLDYAEARLLVSHWMVEGGEGTADFPDDWPDSRGVASREKALAICSRHPRVKEFRALRRFLAATVLEQVGPVDYYWWNGGRWFYKDPLNEILMEADDE